MKPAEVFDVPVSGGDLRVGRWGDGGTVVLAIHGVTANHLSWALVADQLGDDVTVYAPDLRGRGRSGALPGPFGMAQHADDLVAVLDHLGVDRAVVAGHSMGAFVATVTAVRHPDRVERLVLVDGGVAIPAPEGVDVDTIIAAALGPARARLEMTFPTREAYHSFWQAHPAVGGDSWNDALAAYVDYDLVGEAPELRSSVSLAAVQGDSEDMLGTPDASEAIGKVPCEAVLLLAPRGLLNGDPLYPPELIESLRGEWPNVVDISTVPDVNHYTISLSPHGAAAIAAAISG